MKKKKRNEFSIVFIWLNTSFQHFIFKIRFQKPVWDTSIIHRPNLFIFVVVMYLGIINRFV